MSDTSIIATLDRERALDVRPNLVELERVTSVGIGRLVARVIAGEFHTADLAETVRLGLLGGGATPAEAATLARVYVTERPLTEGHALATEVLLAAWNGTARKSDEIAPDNSAPRVELVIPDDGSPIHAVRTELDGSRTPITLDGAA